MLLVDAVCSYFVFSYKRAVTSSSRVVIYYLRFGNATANSADSAGSVGVSAGSVSSKYGKNGGDISLLSGWTYSNVAGTRGGNVLLEAGTWGWRRHQSAVRHWSASGRVAELVLLCAVLLPLILKYIYSAPAESRLGLPRYFPRPCPPRPSLVA